MPKSAKLYRAFGLISLIFVLQACTCWGIEISQFFPEAANTVSEGNAVILPGMDCSNLRLTSPRTGLPNGSVTVYWNTLDGAVSYTVNLYSNGTRIGTWEANAPATSLHADVSLNAVGGENPFELELLAFDANGNSCRDAVVQDREAAQGQVAPATATPTCRENPSASYC